VIRESISRTAAGQDAVCAEDNLLSEVTQLVESPCVILCSFDDKYLEMPAEVLEESMKSHQRYFPLKSRDGAMTNRFLVVANRSCNDVDAIRRGNERVLRARLEDAHFFFVEDTKTRIEAKLPALKDVLFQAKLGTYYDKIGRTQKLARWMAESLGYDAEEVERCGRAAELSKADLVTEMVGEFPTLQGVMGHLYALVDGEDAVVARAIQEHYLPRYSDDGVPTTRTGAVVALADKADTLVGCFAAGLKPSGSQDPYALRRNAQGILRVIVGTGLRFSLSALFEKAAGLLSDTIAVEAATLTDVIAYVRDRLYQQMLDEGFAFDLIRAVLASGFDDATDFCNRLRAIAELASGPAWRDLVTVVERTFNITRKVGELPEPDPSMFAEEAEKQLWEIYEREAAAVEEKVAREDYVAGARAFAEVFGAPVHDFFDKVFVNVEDEAVRFNRLSLIRKINKLFTDRIANLAEIVTEGASEV